MGQQSVFPMLRKHYGGKEGPRESLENQVEFELCAKDIVVVSHGKLLVIIHHLCCCNVW